LDASGELKGISHPGGWKKHDTTSPKAPVRMKTTGKKYDSAVVGNTITASSLT
jgi:hypothetical protein